MNYLLIDATDTVENVIVIEPGAVYTPPEGKRIEPQSGRVWTGWTFVNGEWREPVIEG